MSAPERTLSVVREPEGWDNVRPTIGTVSAPGLALPIFSLEQPWRSNAVSVSCVPEGLYPLVLVLSTRFHRDMPRLLHVPGREGVLIHGGNSTADTSGCILVGRERTADGLGILRSAEALGLVRDWLRRAAMGGQAWCRISRLLAAGAPDA